MDVATARLSRQRIGYLLARAAPTAWRLARSSVARCAERCYRLVATPPQPQDAIVVAGSERSGTTWLADLLTSAPGVQQVFEPLSAMANSGLAYHLAPDHPRVRNAHRWSRRYLRAEDTDHDAEQFLAAVLSGRHRNYWTDVSARRWFPRRYLIKLVHANLMLGFLHARWQPTIVFVMRHPCAVIASRRRGFGGVFRRDTVDRMLECRPLVDDWLTPWLAEIQAARDPLERHAIEWSIENAVARRALAGRSHLFAHYERLVQHPQPILAEWSRQLGLSPRLSPRLLKHPSHTTLAPHADRTSRLESWRHELSTTDIDTILRWARRFGITDYDATPRPVLGPTATNAHGEPMN